MRYINFLIPQLSCCERGILEFVTMNSDDQLILKGVSNFKNSREIQLSIYDYSKWMKLYQFVERISDAELRGTIRKELQDLEKQIMNEQVRTKDEYEVYHNKAYARSVEVPYYYIQAEVFIIHVSFNNEYSL